MVIVSLKLTLRIEFPYISIEEDDEPKHSTQEIFKAIADNDPGSLEALIQEGFSVNLRDLHDVTPLHAACARGLAHIVTVLLNNGAGLNAVTGAPHKTALHIAVSGGKTTIEYSLLW